MKRRLLIIGLITVGVIVVGVGAAVVFATFQLKDWFTQSVTPSYEPAALYQRAVEQVGKGDYQTAELYLEQALEKGDDATYRTQLAVVKYRLGKYDQAIVEYEKLIAAGKDKAFAHNGIGNVYRDWADVDTTRTADYQGRALAAYTAATTADPGFVAAYSNAALVLANQGKLNEAKAVLNQGIAVTNSPELRTVLTQLQ